MTVVGKSWNRLTLPGTRTVTDPVGTHSAAVLPSDAVTA